MTDATDADIPTDKAKALVEKGRLDLLDGNFVNARNIFAEAAALGAVEAHIELADLDCRDGNRAQAQLELDKAEALAAKGNDAYAFVAISGAYQLMLGSGELDEQKSAALANLERAAELGLASAQATIAHWYRFGLNGAKANEDLFRNWVQRGADNGDPLAICELTDYLIKHKISVPIDLACKVRSLSPEYEEARRLLKKLPL